jgi:hypothetical protein
MNFYKLNQIINESVDVRVSDAEYPSTLNDLLELSFELNSKLWRTLKVSPEHGKYYQDTPHHIDGKFTKHPDGPVVVDGDDQFKTTGTLNLYLKPFHPEIKDKAVKAIKYMLDELNVKYGMFKEELDSSGEVRVVRIPVLQLPAVDHSKMPPEMNMSNGNAHHIFWDVLKIPYDYSLTISARDLLMKIDQYDHDMADIDVRLPTQSVGAKGSVFISGGLSGDAIRLRLDRLREIAMWAIKNHYDTIQVA